MSTITPKGVTTLKNRDGKVLRKIYNRAQLEPYVNEYCKDKKSISDESEKVSEDEVPAEEREEERSCLRKNLMECPKILLTVSMKTVMKNLH